jgi:hypothetical protein
VRSAARRWSTRGGVTLLLVFSCLAVQAKDEPPKKTATPSTPPVVLFEAGSLSAGVALADVGRPDVVIPLNWVEKSGKTVELEIALTKLNSGRGAGVEAKIVDPASSSPGPFKLQPREVLSVAMRAHLPDAGTYRAFLQATVIEGKVKTLLDPVPITITRTLAAPPVEFLAAPAQPIEKGWFSAPPNAKLTLEAFTSAAGVRLATPHVQATRKNTVDASVGTVTTLKLVPPSAAASAPALPAGIVMPLPLEFTDIPGPGRYDVALRYVSEGYKPLDATRVLFVREPAGMALLFVFVGVLVSFSIQFWGTVIRPVRELQRRVSTLAEALRAARERAGAAASDPDVAALLDGVRKALQDRGRAGWLDRANSAGSLDVFETIVPAVPVWMSLWQQLDHVRPKSVGKKHQDALLAIRQNFIAAAPDATLVQEGIKALDQMPIKIRADVASALKDEIGKLDASLASDPRAVMLTLRARLRLAADTLGEGQVEAAIGLHEKVVRDFVAVMAKTLHERIDASLQTPPGLEPDEWQKLKDSTLVDLAGLDAQLDVDQALAGLKRATKTYVQGFAAGLLRAVAKSPPKVQDPVKAAVQSLEASIAADNMTAAWEALAKVQEAYAASLQLAGQAMGQQDHAALQAATRQPDGPFHSTTGFSLPGWWARLDIPGTAARIDRHTLLGDVGVSVVSLALACLGVFQTLWVPNPVWGGAGAWLAAVIAGFAVDRVTQAAATALRR